MATPGPGRQHSDFRLDNTVQVYFSLHKLCRMQAVSNSRQNWDSPNLRDHPMKLVYAPLMTTLVVAFAPTIRAQESSRGLETGFQQIFDGKSLEGWEGNPDYFRVEKKSIVAGHLDRKIPHNEFLCTTREYGNFDLRLQVRLAGQGNNAGIQFRSKRIPDSREVSGYQCDVGRAWNRPVWGGLYDESRRRKMLAEGPKDSLPKWVKEGDWNELRILARGDRIQLFLNGHRTIDYVETEADIARAGIIGLQIHSGPPTEAWYRNVRIREIPEDE